MENTLLSGIQTMFLRAHNIFAKELATLNPSWEHLQLYEEARKIVIAFLQHITYKYYLPILFGDYFESCTYVGDPSTYDPKVR